MIGADLLVLFSDIDGLYTAPPAGDPTARHIAVVERITPAIEAMAGGAGSELSRGGMRTKIEAGKIATVGGTHMVIADGRREHPLKAIADGARCTWFLTPSNPVTARKTWIAGALEPRGTLVVDAGAARALAGGASLLPVGVRRIEGAFARGDAVVVSDGARELGRGLVAYDADEAERIIGRASREIEDDPRLPRPRRDDPPRRPRPDAAARGKGRLRHFKAGRDHGRRDVEQPLRVVRRRALDVVVEEAPHLAALASPTANRRRPRRAASASV